MAIALGTNIASLYPDRASGGERYWREFSDTNSGWDYTPQTWNLAGLDFGPPPEPGATPMIEQGVFSGWLSPTSNQFGADTWVPGPNGQLVKSSWMEGPNHVGTGGKILQTVVPLALGAMAGYGALGAAGMLGSQAGGLGGAAGTAGTGSELALSGAIPELGWGGASSVPLGAAGGALPELGALAPAAAGGWTGVGAASSLPWGEMATAGGASPVASTAPTAGGGTGLKLPTNAADWLKTISQGAGMVGAVTGGGGGSSANTGSNTGGLIGAGLGGLLGYLDAKSQPDSLTIKNEIDPRLANLWYGADGAGGLTGEANSVYQQQKGQPNPMMQAGQQISSMANQTPDWAGLVNQNKALFDTNPYIEGILKKTQEGITSQMGKAGFGSGSFGNSGVATQTADALANAENTLRYNAFNDWQNRAMQGAVAGGNYGLNNQQQQANLIGTGATMQSQAPWQNLFNFKNTISGAPGSTSMTQPLFSNPWASAIGGASMGSQIGGGTDWGKVFGNVGSAAGTIGDWFGKLFGGGNNAGGTSWNPSVPNTTGSFNWNDPDRYGTSIEARMRALTELPGGYGVATQPWTSPDYTNLFLGGGSPLPPYRG